jgi:hypothetical protein
VDHDQLFKAVLTAQLPPFLELFFREEAAQLDLEAARFVDKELFAAPPMGPEREVDLLMTLSMAKAKGLLASGYPANELLARCPRELLGAKAPRYLLEASMRPRMTAHVLPAGGLPSGTPRTRDRLCRCTGPKATTHGFSARAHRGNIARVF